MILTRLEGLETITINSTGTGRKGCLSNNFVQLVVSLKAGEVIGHVLPNVCRTPCAPHEILILKKWCKNTLFICRFRNEDPQSLSLCVGGEGGAMGEIAHNVHKTPFYLLRALRASVWSTPLPEVLYSRGTLPTSIFNSYRPLRPCVLSVQCSSHIDNLSVQFHAQKC